MKVLGWTAAEVIRMRELILNHWHCFLPVIAIITAMFFMRDKDADGKQKDKKNEAGKDKEINTDDAQEAVQK